MINIIHKNKLLIVIILLSLLILVLLYFSKKTIQNKQLSRLSPTDYYQENDPRIVNKKEIASHPYTKQQINLLPTLQADLTATPKDPKIIRKIADIQYLQKNTAEAIKLYQEEALINPNDALLYKKLGDSYLENNQIQLAIDAYNQSIKLQSKNNMAYFDLADLYILKLHNYTQAITVYQKAITNNPDDINIKLMLASLYLQNKNSAEAKKIYMQILIIDPTNKTANDALKKMETQ